jgi:DNA replication protein DnaC
MKDLEHYFEELKLKRIPEIYKKEAKIAAEKKIDYTEYLSGLIEKEYQGMIERSVNQRIRRAGFPCIKTIEGYDFTHQPQLNEKLIRNLNTLEYLDNAINIIFVGPPGIGKSHLSIGLGIKACERRKRVQFYTAQELVDDLAKAKLMGYLGRELSKLGRIDLLVLDELGYMDMTKDSANLFFQLVSKRYERGSIILNTNRPFEEWGSLFKDNIVATAILDRLLHHSHVFYFTGKSYRLKKHDSKNVGKDKY